MLPEGLTWVVQIEQPARQIESEQAISLAAAIGQTDLMTQTSKAWSRLARSLGGADDAFDLLGERVQFIAGSRSRGQPWALSIEMDPERRQRLLARLKAFPRLRRDRRPIFELEDGRYLLAIFDRGPSAVALLAPRSDRSMSPEKDPQSALFFEMFDRLTGSLVPAAGGRPNALAEPIAAVGAGELIVARQATALSWNPLDRSLTISDDEDGEAAPDDMGFVALRVDRVAGGWAGRLAVSDGDRPRRADEERSDEFPFEPLAASVPTISWVTVTPGVRSVLPLLSAYTTNFPFWLPSHDDSVGYAAFLRTNRAGQKSWPGIAYVQRVDAEEGPARFDTAVAAAISSAYPGQVGPDHAGRYPGAVRAQRMKAPLGLGPDRGVVWAYSEPRGGVRTAAMITASAEDPEQMGALETMLRALIAGDEASLAQAGEMAPTDAPVLAGSVRLAELHGVYRGLFSPQVEPDPLFSRIESVRWSLGRTKIRDRDAVIGPVSITLTPSRQGGLGTK